MIGIFNNFIQLCFDLFILAWNSFSIPFLKESNQIWEKL